MENIQDIIEKVKQIPELYQILSSESVYRALRYAVKSPSSTGIDDCSDNYYYDLYTIVTELITDNK